MDKQVLTQGTLDEILLSQLTAQQRNAVLAKGGSVLLSASAGSGKTSVLTTRIIYMITKRDAPVDINRLLILTFSNAAANEMKQRISSKLSELLMKFPHDRILQRQKMLLNQTQISTIHSFCLELLREHFDKVNLSPDFKVVDEERHLQNRKDEILQQLLEEYYEKDDESFKALVERFYTKSGQDRNLRQAIDQVYHFIRSHPFPLDWLDESLKKYMETASESKDKWEQTILAHVSSILTYCIAIFDETLEKIQRNQDYYNKYAGNISANIENCRKLMDCLSTKTWDEVYDMVQAFAFEKQTAIRSNAKNYDIDCSKALKSMLQQTNECIKAVQSDYICMTSADFYEDTENQLPEIEKFFELVGMFYRRMNRLKREDNVIDFSDIEELAVQLFLENKGNGYEQTSICEEIQERFHEILVDEFQDTNKTQDMIFQCVSINESNLFMVGDIKQSIYRFRKAMPEIFLEKQKRFYDFDDKTYPANIYMMTNFRSRREVTNPINYMFSQLMQTGMGELDYNEKEALTAFDDFKKLQGMETELQIVDVTKGGRDEETVVLEARHISHQIRTMIQNKALVKDGGTYRPCRFGDFAVLLRSVSGKAQVFYEELQKQGIDAWTKETSGYFSSREIVLVVNLLKVLDNPTNDIPMLSVLLSEIFIFEPDDMARIQIRCPNKKAHVYNRIQFAAKDNDRLGKKCREFLEVFESLRQDSREMALPLFIQRMYNRLLLIEIAGAMEFGSQKQANLRLFLHYADQSADTGYRELSAFVRYLDKIIENDVDFPAANIQANNSNTVKIMTIHNSKGLEFPVCFIANCTKAFNKQDLRGDILMGSDCDFAMKRTEPAYYKKYKTLPYTALALNNEKKMLSEEMRILYVGMTRAKEKLIFTATAKEKKGMDVWESVLHSVAVGLGKKRRILAYKVFCAKSYLDWILMGLARHPQAQSVQAAAELCVPLNSWSKETESKIKFKVFDSIADVENAPEEKLIFHVLPLPEDCEKLEKQLSFIYPYAYLSKVPAKLSVTQLVQEDTNPVKLTKRPVFLQEKQMTGAEIGTLHHTFLQYADFALAKKDISGEIERMVKEGFLSAGRALKLNMRQLKAFFESPLFVRMEQAQKLFREYKFMSEIPARSLYDDVSSGEKILIQGIADCIIDEGDSISIVDYKTDHATPSQLIRRYKPQLKLYRQTISDIFQKPVKDTILYALTLKKEIYL